MRIQCGNALVDIRKYNKFYIFQDELITLYIFNKSCPYEYRVPSNINSPNCMTKITLKISLNSIKKRHNNNKYGLYHVSNKNMILNQGWSQKCNNDNIHVDNNKSFHHQKILYNSKCSFQLVSSCGAN